MTTDTSERGLEYLIHQYLSTHLIKSEPPGRLAGIRADRHLELCLKIDNRPKSIILA